MLTPLLHLIAFITLTIPLCMLVYVDVIICIYIYIYIYIYDPSPLFPAWYLSKGRDSPSPHGIVPKAGVKPSVGFTLAVAFVCLSLCMHVCAFLS